MNQKQRDLLCNMVEKKARKLKETLFEHLSSSERNALSIPSMCLSVGYCTVCDKFLELVPKKELKRYHELKKQSEKAWKETERLDEQWVDWNTTNLRDIVTVKAREQQSQNEIKRKCAIECLEIETERAILKIQFADNAEQAETILNSLPSVDELTSQ